MPRTTRPRSPPNHPRLRILRNPSYIFWLCNTMHDPGAILLFLEGPHSPSLLGAFSVSGSSRSLTFILDRKSSSSPSSDSKERQHFYPIYLFKVYPEPIHPPWGSRPDLRASVTQWTSGEARPDQKQPIIVSTLGNIPTRRRKCFSRQLFVLARDPPLLPWLLEGLPLRNRWQSGPIGSSNRHGPSRDMS